MAIEKHTIASLLLFVVLAQGLQLLHGIDHMLPANDGECVSCLKVENQKHSQLDNVHVFEPLVKMPLLFTEAALLIPQSDNSSFLSRAPPHSA